MQRLKLAHSDVPYRDAGETDRELYVRHHSRCLSCRYDSRSALRLVAEMAPILQLEVLKRLLKVWKLDTIQVK